jgi:hypothetical protein
MAQKFLTIAFEYPSGQELERLSAKTNGSPWICVEFNPMATKARGFSDRLRAISHEVEESQTNWERIYPMTADELEECRLAKEENQELKHLACFDDYTGDMSSLEDLRQKYERS